MATTTDALARAKRLRETLINVNTRSEAVEWMADASQTLCDLVAENEALRRGECICKRCGLRQPGESAGPVPF
jgi:hypothetical protein